MFKFSTGSESPHDKLKGGHFCPPPGPGIESQTPVQIGLNGGVLSEKMGYDKVEFKLEGQSSMLQCKRILMKVSKNL